LKGGGNSRRGSVVEKQTYADGDRLQWVPFTHGAPGRHKPIAYTFATAEGKSIHPPLFLL